MRIVFSVLLAAVLFSSTSFSEEKKNGAHFEENKAQFIKALEGRKVLLNQHIECVKAATNREGMKECRSKMVQTRKELRQQFKDMRKEMKGQRKNAQKEAK